MLTIDSIGLYKNNVIKKKCVGPICCIPRRASCDYVITSRRKRQSSEGKKKEALPSDNTSAANLCKTLKAPPASASVAAAVLQSKKRKARAPSLLAPEAA